MSKLKPGVEFQYGGRLFSETESRHISAVNEILLKFDMLMDFRLLNECRQSLIPKA